MATCTENKACFIEKNGYAKVMFPKGTFATETDVALSISTDAAIADKFN
jgi:hypothetical protein